ncbi:MAG TPA: hypothetical protein V6C57_03750, partial [Coleofasciculaceae cyanobacterium]
TITTLGFLETARCIGCSAEIVMNFLNEEFPDEMPTSGIAVSELNLLEIWSNTPEQPAIANRAGIGEITAIERSGLES